MLLVPAPEVGSDRTDSTRPPEPPPAGHRHDIQVLRALAVALVVLYHLNVPGFGAGFVGVDVFFVISGFLIARALLVELQTSGRIRLGRFTARRVRRLLPMSFLVFVATLLLVRSRLGPLQQLDAVEVGEATATFRANFALAARGTDYLATDDVSPFQHYWSLAVEEQFYLALPIVLLVLGTLVSRTAVLRAATLLFIAVAGGSLALALQLSATDPSTSYFLLHTRAWEFLVGALVAVLDLRGRRPSAAPAWRALGLVGVGVAMLISHRVSFPGPGALPPVFGTAVLVWAGIGAASTDFASARWAAARWIGDRSYSIYLWHWPPIAVFGLDETPFSDRWTLRVAVLVGCLVAAAVTYALVEKPLRSSALLGSNTRSIALLVVVTLVGYLMVWPMLRAETSTVFGPPAPAVIASTLVDGPPAPPAQLPRNVRPALAAAADDLPPTYENGCMVDLDGGRPLPFGACTYGDPDGDDVVVLIGDSHAAQWFDAVLEFADQRGARFVSSTKSACSLSTVSRDAYTDACGSWRAAIYEQLRDLSPEVIVFAGAVPLDQRADVDAWALATTEAVEALRAAVPTASLVHVLDPPPAEENVPFCLAEFELMDCAAPPDPDFDAVQREVTTALVDIVVEPARWLCDEQQCPPVIGDVLVLRDEDHLSRPVVELVTPLFLDALGPLAPTS